MVASGKGGTGKTTAVANIGAALAASGSLTVLVDMDMGLRNLDIALGLESEVVYDFTDFTDGRHSLDDVLVKVGGRENLYFIAAPQTRPAAEIDGEKLAVLWERLRERFDFCIVDAPAGIGTGFAYASSGADEAVIVSLAETAALRDADRAVSAFIKNRETQDDQKKQKEDNSDKKNSENSEDTGENKPADSEPQKHKLEIKLLMNRIRPDLIEKKLMPNIDECMDMISVPVIGIVPEDEELIRASLSGRLAADEPLSSAGTAFSNTARRIKGEHVPIMEFKRKSFFKKLAEAFKK